MAGITDPYELYQHVHPSEVGTSIGSGMGSMEPLSAMFRDRYATIDPDPQNKGEGADMTCFTAVRKKMSRKISFRKREFNFF